MIKCRICRYRRRLALKEKQRDFHVFLLAVHLSLSRFPMFSLVVINFVFCCSLVFIVFLLALLFICFLWFSVVFSSFFLLVFYFKMKLILIIELSYILDKFRNL